MIARSLALLALVAASLSAQGVTQMARPVSFDPQQASQLRYRYVGPVGNRAASVAGVIGDPNIYYVGAASGGIWKTVDAGIHWTPIFDNQTVQSVGALAVAATSPNIVWAGTGEPWIRSHISIGDGVYKSTDAGATWTHMGLDSTGRIGRIVIDPNNPDIVFVAAQGHSYGPQPDRGLYRTTDGGRTWSKVLFVDQNTGAIDVQMSPADSKTLFAAMWQLEIHTYNRESGGPGSGIYVSHDGGTTWSKLQGNGLPTHVIGKVGLAISRSNPNRVYALIETGDGNPLHGQPTDNGELWRSDDGGTNWRVISFDRDLACRQPYYTRMAVAPDNPDETYFLCASFNHSMDGGLTVEAAGARAGGGGRRGGGPGAPQPAGVSPNRSGFTAPGGDNHDIWIDPTNPNRMAVANDAGVQITTTRGHTWLHVQLPIGQIYHVTADNQIPYYVYGNKQDGPSYRGPSNSLNGNKIERSEWHGVEGGESGWATPDPVDPNIIWSTASGSGAVGGIVIRYDEKSRTGQNVEVWPLSTGGHAAADVPYRFIWDAPFTISPHDHNTVYTGSQYVHRSTDGGKSWQIISPDLTRNDKTKQQISGGLTPDDIGVEYGDVVYGIAESPVKAGVIWAGTNDGYVQVTQDAGKTWTNVTPKIAGSPEWGSFRTIEPSHYDAGTAYAINDGHQENNRRAWVYRTKDYGRTWELIVNGLPQVPNGYAHVIREDPVRRGLLYLGTENGLYVSFDDGGQWQSLQSNLPHAPVYGMVIQPHFDDLVISTYGRGIWIMDDLSPLQKLTPDVMASSATLFPIRNAYRFRTVNGNYSMSDDPTAGDNPPYGADINYWLARPSGAVSIAILDAAGKTVRNMNGPSQPGFNRAYWDLRNNASKTPRMLTKPINDAEFTMASDGGRDAGFGGLSVLMPPGTYTVRLTVDGQSYTQPLSVLKDPNEAAGVTEADIRSATDALLAIQKDAGTTADMVNTAESVRAQLQALRAQLANDPANADVRQQGEALEQKFTGVENNLEDLRLTGRGQDGVRYPARVGQQLGYLNGGISASDFAPTTQQVAVQQGLAKDVRDNHAAIETLIAKDLAAFNALLKTKGLKTIEVTLPAVVF